MRPHLLIYGTIAIDTLVTPKGRVDCVPGGSGLYAALAARLFTADTVLLGVVGDDFPMFWKDEFEMRNGIDFRWVAKRPGRTFSWTGCYETDMNRRTTLRTEGGVQADWKPTLHEELRGAKILALANVTPRLQMCLLEQCLASEPRPVFIASDFMKSWIERERDMTDQLLNHSDLALMNEEEALSFSGQSSITAAGEYILSAGPRYAIVKQGSNGSLLFHRRKGEDDVQVFSFPASDIPCTIDPTGAGDTYLGALCGYLAHLVRTNPPELNDILQGMHYATVAAGKCCTAFGTLALAKLTSTQLQTATEQYKAKLSATPERWWPHG